MSRGPSSAFGERFMNDKAMAIFSKFLSSAD
jgi:hypothetical protein